MVSFCRFFTALPGSTKNQTLIILSDRLNGPAYQIKLRVQRRSKVYIPATIETIGRGEKARKRDILRSEACPNWLSEQISSVAIKTCLVFLWSFFALLHGNGQVNSKVILCLRDGRKIGLDSVPKNKLVANQGNVTAFKTHGNKLVYKLVSRIPNYTAYNSITTRKTCSFRVRLPDRSEVHLSYGSSLRYPLLFGGENQVINLQGEACFNVGQHEVAPLIVAANGIKIEALPGAYFNFMGYADEPEDEISLFKGSLKIVTLTSSSFLKPGEQALVTKNTIEIKKMTDTIRVLSWASKRWQMSFYYTDFTTVIRRIARWKGLKVYNPSNIKGLSVVGSFDYKEPIDEILKTLETIESGAVFVRRRGNRILITSTRPALEK